MPSDKIHAVATNVITGFLGVGKTTAILHLLKEKPANERWAVLVNEFGEIGVDGSLLEGQHPNDSGIFIREVPGGCMCCAAGLPMQIALNQLLADAKPDRLLIEPTGLGHPIEVMEVLTGDHFQDILNIQRIVTLVDARKLSDQRYTEHQTFKQQIAVADLIVGNKKDLYQVGDETNLMDFVESLGLENSNVTFVEQGRLSLDWLAGPTGFNVEGDNHSHSISQAASTNALLSEQAIPDCGYLMASNQGEGFSSRGWRFSPTIEFNRHRLLSWINSLSVERLKAVFITTQGIFGYNLSDGVLTEIELDDCFESRVEMIAANSELSDVNQILSCIENRL